MRFATLAACLFALVTQGFGAEASGDTPPKGSPYQAFEILEATPVELPDATIHVAFAPGRMALGEDALLSWVRESADVVAGYFGRFPVAEAKLLFIPTDGDRVRSGNAFGHRGAAVRVFVGIGAREEALRRDWILVHELTHLAVPNVERQHHWLEEGIAVYVESIARLQAGDLSEEFVWEGFVDGMPHGLPKAGDRGIDRTPSWGRTYWGGALFCLIADVRIRQQTDNRFGLQDALRAVVDAGGNIEHRWPVTRIFEVGDRATGVDVLTELYESWRTTSVAVDLDQLWADLGVSAPGEGVAFDESAPLATVRRVIGSPTDGEG